MPQNKSANAFTAATGLESLDNQMDVLIGTEHGPTTEIACPYHKLTSWLAKYVDMFGCLCTLSAVSHL